MEYCIAADMKFKAMTVLLPENPTVLQFWRYHCGYKETLRTQT